MSTHHDIPGSCSCAACTEAAVRTLVNGPGRSSLSYRLGTHGSFKEAMIGRLSRTDALRPLSTRDDDDPSLALVDAWAVVLDVLSFYQERIVNEGFLRTATERRSILELARSIGYELGPGVAAGTFLSFTVEDSVGTPGYAEIPTGTRVQSLPGPGETPQTFETTSDITARAEWNAMLPKTSQARTPRTGDREIYLLGTSTGLRAGDALAFIGSDRISNPSSGHWAFRRIAQVEVDAAGGRTRVTWVEPLAWKTAGATPSTVRVFAMRQRASLFGNNAPDWRTMPLDVRKQYAADYDGRPTLASIGPSDFGLALMGRRLSVKAIDPAVGKEWPGFTLSEIDAGTGVVHLDAIYPAIINEGWVVLATATDTELYGVTQAVESSQAQFTLTSKTMRLTLSGVGLKTKFDKMIRQTAVFAQSEELEIAQSPIVSAITGNSITLDRVVSGLVPGQLMIVSGNDATSGVKASEVVIVREAPTVGGTTEIRFDPALQHGYVRSGVRVSGNIAPATHGETKKEILGSGDGSAGFQRFTLKAGPLTYVSAETPAGSVTTLEVRVDGILWSEAPSFNDLGPRDRAYVVRIEDDGKVNVRFGDGITGARLPTGYENVTAKYRVGTGVKGMVHAGQLSLLLARPLGVKSVVNPTAPTGAADPQSLEDARENAPFAVMAMGRVVSLQDYEDFARSFAGVAKALAQPIWAGDREVVYLTVAGADGTAVPHDSRIYRNLTTAIRTSGGARRVEIATYESITFDLSADLMVDPRYIAADVLAAVRAMLLTEFSFERRAFGQPVHRSEILAAIQRTAGVEAVTLTALARTGTSGNLSAVPARLARWVQAGGTTEPAQLLTISPDGITLQETQR